LGEDRVGVELPGPDHPLPLGLRALGAVEADRRLAHAVGTDGAIATLADDAGPTVRVAITGLHSGLHGGTLPVAGPDSTATAPSSDGSVPSQKSADLHATSGRNRGRNR